MTELKSRNAIYLQLSVITLAFLALYYPFIRTMVGDWIHNENYSHGFLIPFIAGYMIYSRRGELKASNITPATWGILVLIAGLCQLFLGKIGSEFFLQRTSIIVVLFGLTLLIWGKNITAKVGVPLIYLIFMVPLPAIIWNRIAFPMQLFAAKLSADAIGMIGIAVLREGNILHLANTSLEVAEACSGLRSLTSLLALSAALAYISSIRNSGRWVLFFSAIPIAIFVNIIRLTVTAILARYVGAETAQGFLHELSGLIIYILALILLYLTYRLLGRIKFFHAKADLKGK